MPEPAEHYIPKAEILRAIEAHDEAAFGRIALLMAEKINASFAGDRHRLDDVEDAISDCALRIYQIFKRGMLDQQRNPFAYLTVAARNQLKQRSRNLSRRIEINNIYRQQIMERRRESR